MEPAYEEPQSNQIAGLMVNMLIYMLKGWKKFKFNNQSKYEVPVILYLTMAIYLKTTSAG